VQSRIQSKQVKKARERRTASGPGQEWEEPLWRKHAASRRAAWWLCVAFVCACWAGGGNLASAAAQETVPPDATPSIISVEPSEAQPGARVTLTIDGERFATGAYVSFSDPAIHVLATRRLSGKRLEVDVAIGDKAPPEAVRLYVANPAGTSGESVFAIASGTPTAMQPPASTSGSPTAAEPPAPAPALPTAAQPPASSSGAPTATLPPESESGAPTAAEPVAAAAAAPEVSKVDPAHVAAGNKASIKVTGKKFVKGAKVAFANPGIRVLGTDFKKSTQLVAEIEVASNAATGKTSLFVVNPDESEVETSFEVTAASSTSSKPSSQKAATGAAANTKSQSFSVMNLGDAISILQNPNKPRGTLVLAGGKLTYQEAGKDVFVAGPGEVKEVAPNILFGFNTSTFHIILSSGKTYNFVAASLMPSDTASIVTALQQAFP